MYDVLIVGGGPAGLSAALVLGRCRRSVLLIDSGNPRNAVARAMHGYLSRDGTPPAEFRQLSREQIAKYDTVELRSGCVEAAERGDEHFTIRLRGGEEHSGRILLLATGLVDDVPELEGIHQFYGKSVHLCPYCDGWEHKDEEIFVFGPGQMGADLALEMLGWSSRVTWLTGGDPEQVGEGCIEKMEHYKIRRIDKQIARLEGEGEQIRGVRFADCEFLPCEALFFASTQHQQSPLAEQLGCEICPEDAAVEHHETNADAVPGLFVAGNTSRGLQLVIVAAAEGTLAAFKINQCLLDADQERFKKVISTT